MSTDSDLQIGPLSTESIPDLVAIHRAAIGYSLNSKLGPDHLARMYAITRSDRDSAIVVARLGGKPVGVVIATLDPARLTRQVMVSLKVRQWLQLAMRVAAAPSALVDWLEGLWLGRPISVHGKEVTACLLAIAVDGNVQGRGVGKALVGAVDDFCQRAGHTAYRLDTRVANSQAQEFYRRNGFVSVERRGRNVIWMKELAR